MHTPFKVSTALTCAAFGFAMTSLSTNTHAHAIAGARIFPSTMAVDDPGVGDEMDIQFAHTKAENDDDTINVNTITTNYAKTITPNLAVSIGGNYTRQTAADSPTIKGFDNLNLGIKYLAYVNPAHEFMLSVGLNSELGNSGSQAIGSTYSSYTPTLYMGKGFGDLPDALNWLKPIAITGSIGQRMAVDRSVPDTLNWGMNLQYSLPYLQNFVKDIGLPVLLSHVIPVLEIALNTCTSGACSGHTTGTINPGILWTSRTMQLGVEAQIPANSNSGHHIGVLLQTHFFFDDVFPKSLGKPIFKS